MLKEKKVLPLPKLIAKCQSEFNKWIRKRDQDLGCISCQGKVEQAGHFYNAGQNSALRFHPDNCAGQCVQCNYYRSGNLIPYRINLEKRIGKQRLDLLDSTATRNRVKKWNRGELEIIYLKYKKLNGQG